MNSQQLYLRPVYELRLDNTGQPMRYFIPAYQRGYRWTPTQVTQLLDDLYEFYRRRPQAEEFYCLQPLVLIRRDDGAYEVVDGQQRLTTLLLILRYLNESVIKKRQIPLYQLHYETRSALLEFLENPTGERAAENIDFYHVSQATTAVEAWLTMRENEVDGFKGVFLNQAKVIWFELAADENRVAAFTRLNVGKIPLSSGELIRALLLRRSPGEAAESRRLRIAYEWDLVEKSLQDKAFWSFVSNDTTRSGSRIDILFELAASQQGMQPNPDDDHATFNHFSKLLAEKAADPENVWLEVKKIYLLLSEWFEDRKLYHMVGFLIWDGMDLNELRSHAAGCKKGVLKQKLRAMTVTRAFEGPAPAQPQDVPAWITEQLETLEYPRNSGRIRAILLLFNLATLLLSNKSNIRFNFESFKTARWDIEHVRSVAAAELGSVPLQTAWLENTLRYLKQAAQDAESTALQQKIVAHLELPAKERMAAFELLNTQILKHFREDDGGDPDNSIANLALLDQETNRSYKNAVFPVKRQRVLELDEHGVFVPHCTRNVFLKCYSPHVDHTMYWTTDDRDGYRKQLIETLSTFVTGGWIDERA